MNRAQNTAQKALALVLTAASPSGKGEAFVSVKLAGARGDGLHDDSPDFQTSLATTSAQGETTWTPAGTYLIAGNVDPPNGSVLRGSPATTIKQQLPAGAHTYPTSAWLYAAGLQGAGASTLAGTPTLYGTSVSVTGGAKPPVGSFLELTSQGGGASKGGQSVYRIVTSPSVAAPWAVTVERPIVFPFQAGDLTQVYSSVPQDIEVDGVGMTVSGTGDQVVELARGTRCHVRRLNYNPTLGVVGSAACEGSVVGLDVGMTSSTIEDCTADITGAPATAFSGCFYAQSAERCVLARNVGSGVPANGQGAHALLDCFSSSIEDSWAYGGAANAPGFSLLSLDPVNYSGCLECTISGGGAVGTGAGATVQGGSTGCTITGGWSAVGCQGDGITLGLATATTLGPVVCANNGANGITVGATTVRTKIVEAACTGNVGAGVQIQSDTTFSNLDVSHSGGGAGHNSVGALDVRGAAVVTGLGLKCSLAAGEAAFGVLTGGTSQTTLTGPQIDTVGFGALVVGGTSRLVVEGGEISVTGGTCVFAQAGTVTILRGVKGTGTGGSTGVSVAANATVRMQDCDFSGCATPVSVAGGGFLNSGTVQLNGVAAVDVTWPDLKSTDNVQLTLVSLGGAGTGLAPTVSYTPGTKFTVTGVAGGDTSTWAWFIPA